MDSTMKVMLLCGAQKKIVTIPRKSLENAFSFLQQEAKHLFDISSPFVVQYFDQDFEEWADIDLEYIPKNKEKLQIVLTCTPPINDLDISLPIDQDDHSTIGSSDLANDTSSVPEDDLSFIDSTQPTTFAPELPHSSKNDASVSPVSDSNNQPIETANLPNNVPTAASPVIVISSDDDKEIPDPFPFPTTYGTNVDVALMTGCSFRITYIENMGPSTTAKFYTRIAGIMSIYRRYPRREDYDRIARAIIHKYPFLKNPICGHTHIITVLKNRLREIRRVSSKESKAAVVRKIGENKFMPKLKKPKLEEKIPPLQVPEGEDDASFVRHNRALKSESKKVKPNRAVVAELMKLSFEMRRNDILSREMPITELLSEYPFLGDSMEIITEFSRIINNGQLIYDYQGTWEHQWLPKIVTKIKATISESSLKQLKPVIGSLEDFDNQPSSCLTVKVLYVLAFLLKDHKSKPVPEKLLTLIPATADITAVAKNACEKAPSIIVSGQLDQIKEVFLMVEGKVVCKVDPIQSPLTLLGAYYIFNMTYPKGLNTLYAFLEHIILDKNPIKMSNSLSIFLTNI